MSYRCEVCTSLCQHAMKRHTSYRLRPAQGIYSARQEISGEEAVCAACQYGLQRDVSRAYLRRRNGPESRDGQQAASVTVPHGLEEVPSEAKLATFEKAQAQQQATVQRLLKPEPVKVSKPVKSIMTNKPLPKMS